MSRNPLAFKLALGVVSVLVLTCAAIGGVALTRLANSHANQSSYYVSSNGSDTNPGTQQAPFLTLQHAAAAASSPGTTVHVLPGTYASSSSIYTKYSGTSLAPIVFVSDTPWAAKIVVSGDTLVWYNSGDFVHIVGFDITNTNGASNQGIDNGGSYTLIAGNKIHDIAQWGCPAYGAAINDSNYAASGDDDVANVIERIGPPSYCNSVHGIYHANNGGHVWNNIVDNTSGYGIHCWHADTGVVIANNVVFDNARGGIIFGAGDAPGGVTTDGMVVTNNIAFNNGSYGIREYGAVGTHNVIDHNDTYGNSSGAYSLLNGNTATNALNANPQFVDWLADGSGDYHLNSTSPLIDAGTSQGAPADDFAGITRPQGNGYDIGAYEFVTPTTPSSGGSTGANQLQNGSFSVPAWTFRTDGQATFGLEESTTGSGGARIAVPVADSCDCAVQLYQSPVTLTAGDTYTLTFSAKASVIRTIRPAVLHAASPWTSYFSQSVSLTTSWQQFTLTFSAPTSDTNAAVLFNLGNAAGMVWINDVGLSN